MKSIFLYVVSGFDFYRKMSDQGAFDGFLIRLFCFLFLKEEKMQFFCKNIIKFSKKLLQNH